MPFLKDFIINNSTKIMTWNIVSGELDESHLNEYDKNLLKKRKSVVLKNTKSCKEFFENEVNCKIISSYRIFYKND